ncbi:MAG: hypothetical protein ACFFKA_20895, partial [Candidatus Thorarchaeota archaeon]
MDKNRKFVVNFDILGFDEQAKQIEKIFKIASWKARKNVIDEVNSIIITHIRSNKYAKTSPDSWMFLFNSGNSTLEFLKNIKETMEMEYSLILIECSVTYGNIECDEYFWLTDEAMLAVKLCGKYRNIYKKKHNDFPRKSFTLIHSDALKELEAIENNIKTTTYICEKIDELNAYKYDPSFFISNECIDTMEEPIETIDDLIEPEKDEVFLYSSSDLLGILKNLIKKSKNIDLYLYTGETFAIAYREILQIHPDINIRVLVIDPESADGKKTATLGCIELWKEICGTNDNCKISMRFYNHPPLLRAIVFDGIEGFLGMYKWNPDHPFQFVGVERNKIIHAKKGTKIRILTEKPPPNSPITPIINNLTKHPNIKIRFLRS